MEAWGVRAEEGKGMGGKEEVMTCLSLLHFSLPSPEHHLAIVPVVLGLPAVCSG